LNKALDELRTGRGSHFDPKVVDAFLDLIATDTVHLPLPTKEQGQRPLPARPDEAAQTAA
jgi:HD-GYP domain-containing protein (c-di-GMP phosphodiesterase class II)